MPRTNVVFYCEGNGEAPFLNWLDTLPEKAQDKCRLKIERLRALGFELRRPEADFLRDGIYELRVRLRKINYRVLYFFHSNIAAVVSHGIIKERIVPPNEIEKAVERKKRFEKDPERYTYQEE
ncbi:MAG TPA: type II toxin-antitoxin system RelE/ParE family toxin [Gemmataceae bacterium]|jgi:phage-related protein|nr:type II toxin-antitoxin system RelE/ParE family toxin [Gemmataceae bacterium]